MISSEHSLFSRLNFGQYARIVQLNFKLSAVHSRNAVAVLRWKWLCVGQLPTELRKRARHLGRLKTTGVYAYFPQFTDGFGMLSKGSYD